MTTKTEITDTDNSETRTDFSVRYIKNQVEKKKDAVDFQNRRFLYGLPYVYHYFRGIMSDYL